MTFTPYAQAVFSLMAGAVLHIDSQYKNYYKFRPTAQAIFLTMLSNNAKLGIFDELSSYENLLTVKLSYFISQNTELKISKKKKVIQLNYGYFF